jgi:PAS domain S-box-containing protein
VQPVDPWLAVPPGERMRRWASASVAGCVLVIPFIRHPAKEDPGVYRDLFDQAADGRFVLDAQYTILHANPAAARLFGASENVLYGVPFSELLSPSARPSWVEVLSTTRKIPSRAGPVSLQGRYSDGSMFPIDLEVIHGTEDRYGVVVRDGRAGQAGPAGKGRLNPGQMLIAGRIQELV